MAQLPCIGLSKPLTKPPFGSCALYFHYVVLVWGTPNVGAPLPVAHVLKMDYGVSIYKVSVFTGRLSEKSFPEPLQISRQLLTTCSSTNFVGGYSNISLSLSMSPQYPQPLEGERDIVFAALNVSADQPTKHHDCQAPAAQLVVPERRQVEVAGKQTSTSTQHAHACTYLKAKSVFHSESI